MLADKLRSATAGEKLYVDDVFGVNLQDGNGSFRSANLGIDLSGKGGLVITKCRNEARSWRWVDTVRGASSELFSDTTGPAGTDTTGLTAFTSTGATFGVSADYNGSGRIFVDYLIRKAPKFFDVVTYTGNDVQGRDIAHSLGVEPGMIIVKCTNTALDWHVYHRSPGGGNFAYLNGTSAFVGSTSVFPTGTTSTTFKVGSSLAVNGGGYTYVAYLFAHDTATDGMIQCGSFTTTLGNATVNLGWEPQYILYKRTDESGDWFIADNMVGTGATLSGMRQLRANLTNAEFALNYLTLNSQGFDHTNGSLSTATFIYLAIRRPNKPPTTGTQVFNPTVYTGTNVDNRLINTGILTDMVWLRQRNGSGAGYEGFVVGDRLRGQPWLKTGATQAEQTVADGLDQQLVSAVEYGTAFSSMNGVWVGNNSGAAITATNVNANTTASNHVALAFKRAPGFFDMVAYTGTGVVRTVSHNLGAVPELMIVKDRGQNAVPVVYYGNNATYLQLSNSAAFDTSSLVWNNTSPTSTQFTAGTIISATSANYIAYLFATLPGISKVGTYTGNGGIFGSLGPSQTIDCGFTTGARFVMIKRTDSTGDWWVFDAARGIVAAGDPFLRTNSTGPEAAADDVDQDNSGFVVNQTGNANLNVTSATYIFLAVS